MKKFVLLFTAIAIFATASATKAETSNRLKIDNGRICQKSEPDETKSSVELFADETSAIAVLVVSLKGEDGKPLPCNFAVITTSRNNGAPDNGWEKDVDKIVRINDGFTNDNGKVVFILKTDEPAGTTVYIFSEGVAIGNPEGIPFSYGTPIPTTPVEN